MPAFLRHLFEPKSNAPETAKLLVDELNVKITATTLYKEIQEHPNYPSLASVSDVLSHYGIDNLAMTVSEEKISDVPVPFITPIKGEKSDTQFFTTVKSINDDNVTFYDPEQHKWDKLTKTDFLKKSSGIVLVAEKRETGNVGEEDYEYKRKEEKRNRFIQQCIAFCIPIIIILTSIFAFLQIGAKATFPVIFVSFTLIGAIIGVLLLWYELDQYNPILQQICSAGKKTNCGAVLNSTASKIAGISWSTIGFTYFLGQLLLLLFTGITNSRTLIIVSWLNTLALPYIFFSIYYQWKIAKQWCVLCLFVQALLLLQFITSLIGGWHVFPFADTLPTYMEGIELIPIAFAIPFIVVTLLIPALKKNIEIKRTRTELQQLKHNPEIFQSLLVKQRLVPEPPKGLGITLGAPSAKYKLIKVCGPYCGPCAKAHVPMEKLLENNPEVQIQIIFNAYDNDLDLNAQIARHLLAIYESKSEMETREALDHWYLTEKKDYNTFAAKYPLNGLIEKQNLKIKAMRDWCDKIELNFTPTFFLSLPTSFEKNTTEKFYQLPKSYSVYDLKYFLSI